jgi:hypothetical protein
MPSANLDARPPLPRSRPRFRSLRGTSIAFACARSGAAARGRADRAGCRMRNGMVHSQLAQRRRRRP